MREETGTIRQKRRAVTPELKADAVRLARASDHSIGQVAKELDLTETALRAWVKQAEIDAGKGPSEALTTAEREELLRLRRDSLQGERTGDTDTIGELSKANIVWIQDVYYLNGALSSLG